MIELQQLELWIERLIWLKSAIDLFEKYGDCSLVYYALLRHIELYEWE